MNDKHIPEEYRELYRDHQHIVYADTLRPHVGKLIEELGEARAALSHLLNEAIGFSRLVEMYAPDSVGKTNLAVIKLRIHEAEHQADRVYGTGQRSHTGA